MAESAPARPATALNITDAAAKLRERWGADVRDDRAEDDVEPERLDEDKAPTRREVRQAEIDAEAEADAGEEQQAGSPEDGDAVESGESGSDDGGETPAFATLDELLNAGGVTADALTVRVKRNGQESEVPLAEALSSHMLEADYRVKTQALSDERKTFESERAAALAAVQQISQQAEAMKAVIGEAFDQEAEAVHNLYRGVDWNSLLAQDRTEWLVHQQQYKDALAAVDARRQAALSSLEEKSNGAAQVTDDVRRQYLAEQRQKLNQYVPEWVDDTVAQKGMTEVAEYFGSAYDVSPELRATFTDARYWDLGRKAMQRDRWQAKADAIGKTIDEILDAATKAPAVAEQARLGTLRPGAGSLRRPVTGNQREEQAAREKLKKSGKQRDAEAAMLARFNQRG